MFDIILSRLLLSRYCTLFLLSYFLFIFQHTYAVENDCTLPTSSNDILRCLQSKHPEVLNSESIQDVSTHLANQGNSWNNPEISFQTTGGNNLGTTLVDSELRLSQTIEFSGQRSARKKIGVAQGDLFKAESHQKLEEVTLVGIKALYRLSQIKDEILKIKESIGKFKEIKSQYQSRLKLSPEQETVLGILTLAISEFEVKLSQTKAEQISLLNELSSYSRFTSEQIQSNLPQTISQWPEVPQFDSEIKTGTMQKLKAELNYSKGELELAKAEAWPEFTVDIILQNKIDGVVSYQMYGAGITMPFPIFQRNQGQKRLKAIEHFRSQKLLAASEKKQTTTILNLIKIYQDAVQNLKNTPSSSLVENKHAKSEGLFAQGLISGSLIIEVHKQILDYTLSRNAEELRAIESLWSLYIYKGNFLEQKI